MKNYTIFYLLFSLLVLLSSCSVKNYIAPPYTDVDKILQLEPGLTYDEVSDVLQIKPYDIVHSYESGSMILIYNYRVIDRKMAIPARAANQIVHSKDAQKEGDIHYNTNGKELYLLFAEDSLKSVFGERTFSEGSYIELADKNIITPHLNGTSSSGVSETDFAFLQNVYQERNALRQEELLVEDERIKKRREWVKNAIIGALATFSLFSRFF